MPDAIPHLAGQGHERVRTFLIGLASLCASQGYAIDWELAELCACCPEHEDVDWARSWLERCAETCGDSEPLLSISEAPCDCGTCNNLVRSYSPTDSFRQLLRHYEPRPNRAERRRAARKRQRRRRRR